MAEFATTAKAGPDREVDPAAIRCSTGLISNLCGVFGLAVVFMLDVSLQRADAGESKPLRWLFATRELSRWRRMLIFLDFSTALNPLS